MTTNQQMFLLVAEELSFTRAAARAYVSQSCLSDHVRRLEESYGVRLFDRSPKLKLTAAGETLCRALRQIQSIERGVQQEFSGGGALARGTVTLGIHPVRARQLLPGLFAAYREEYPGIHLSVVLGETRKLAPQLLDGKLDLFLGVDALPHPNLSQEPLRNESIWLLATRQLLQELGREPTPEEIAEEMHMSVERVREILKISQEPVSLETPIGEEEDSHLGDFIQDDNVPVPADAAAFTMLKEQLEDVLSTLTDREQKVLRLRFGLDDGRARTLEEVGKEFNVTRERIRQIEAKALRKLRHPSRSRKLKDYLD